MKTDYQKIIDFMVESGKRLVTKSGRIADIGVTKQFLTEEDIRIERGLKEIIESFGDKHILFAEEENDFVSETDDLWVVDPISGTESFIKGTELYTIAVAHTHQGILQFAAVYHPAKDDLYTAYLGGGAYLNGQPIRVNDQPEDVKIELRISWRSRAAGWQDKIKPLLSPYEIFQYDYARSIALSYCDLASGKTDGLISNTKDCFPEFAGNLIVREAGGQFTNLAGNPNMNPADRIFVGAKNKKLHEELLRLTREADAQQGGGR